MSFDATQAVQETITHLEDQLKGLEQRREASVRDLDAQINSVKEQLDGWVNLLGDKPKPTAKKAAAKK